MEQSSVQSFPFFKKYFPTIICSWISLMVIFFIIFIVGVGASIYDPKLEISDYEANNCTIQAIGPVTGGSTPTYQLTFTNNNTYWTNQLDVFTINPLSITIGSSISCWIDPSYKYAVIIQNTDEMTSANNNGRIVIIVGACGAIIFFLLLFGSLTYMNYKKRQDIKAFSTSVELKNVVATDGTSV